MLLKKPLRFIEVTVPLMKKGIQVTKVTHESDTITLETTEKSVSINWNAPLTETDTKDLELICHQLATLL